VEEAVRKARAVGSRAALMAVALFFGLLIVGIITVAVSPAGGSPILTAICIGPFLTGFLIAAAYYIRTRKVSRETFTLALDADSVRPGDKVSGTIALHPTRPIRLRSIEAKIWGGEKTSVTVSRGDHSVTYTQEDPWVDETLEVAPQGLAATVGLGRPGGEPLPPGEYFHRFEFQIPGNAIPSWSGSSAKVRCLVKVRIVIERGLDAVQEAEVRVLPKLRRAERTPWTFGPLIGLQVTLESRELSAGDVIVGSIAVIGMEGKKIRGIRVRLIEEEWAIAKGCQSRRRKTLAETTVSVQALHSTAIPFQLPIPPDARPSIVGVISSLRYLVQIHADIALGRDTVAEGVIDILPPWGQRFER